MRHYTLLGEGKTVKVLATHDNGFTPARTVVTCSAEAARHIARHLVKTDREIPSALYPVAVAAAGQPVQARRHLLGVYDRVANGGSVEGIEEPWGQAERIVSRLADCVVTEPEAVKAAVRAELADHLEGLDGVLVHARAEGTAYRGGVLDLVVSGALDALDDGWWEYLLGPHGDLSASEPWPHQPQDGRLIVETMELYAIIDYLWDAEPAGDDYSSTSMRLLEGADGDHQAMLTIPVDLFAAWVRHHRPTDAARVAKLLGC